jgi:hypothetical protein
MVETVDRGVERPGSRGGVPAGASEPQLLRTERLGCPHPNGWRAGPAATAATTPLPDRGIFSLQWSLVSKTSELLTDDSALKTEN